MLSLRRDAYDEIIDRGYAGDDEEVCGVLAGERAPDDAGDGAPDGHVTAVFPATNVADAPQVRYAMDPEEQLALIDRLEAQGLDLVGFYHSHPAGPPRPSQTDADRARWPGYSYVICAFDGRPYLGSWRWTGSEFERERVAVLSGERSGE
ncbi:MAG: desampylase [Haloquadratum sp.]